MSATIPPTGKNQLLALTNLITSAVRDVLSEYDAVDAAIPLLESTNTGPFDTPEAVTAKLARAIKTIEAACAQLSFTVASPGHVILNKAIAFQEPAAMLVITEGRIADILLDKSEGLHINDIAQQAKLPSGKLGRILRALATKHVFNEVKPDVFANNRLSLQLLSTNPVSGLIGHLADESMKASAYLNDNLINPSKELSLVEHSPFKTVHGVTMFEFYNTPKGKPLHDRFSQAMIGWGNVTGKALPKVYAWDKVPSGSTICDIGGGNGHVTMALLKAFPDLKIVLQDLPKVVEQGKEYWAKEYPKAVESGKIEFAALDFLKDVPVKGCNFYYLRHILHDWPDSECLKILENVRKATEINSRLLIHEFVLQHAVRDTSSENITVSQAPEPLLANWGPGSARLYTQDLIMMCNLNSKERTLQEFVQLAGQTGFKFEHLWDSSEAGILEFSVV